MSSAFDRIKLILEIAGLTVGLTLGVHPSRGIATRQRLPGELIEHMKAVPQRTKETLLKDEEFAKLLPDAALREQVSEAARRTAQTHYYFEWRPEELSNGLLAIFVRNTGERFAQGSVRLALEHGRNASVRVVDPAGTVRDVTIDGRLELGDLPPNAKFQAFAWGTPAGFNDASNVTVVHRDGVGEVWAPVTVPASLWRTSGVFFSYQLTTYFLLSVVLVYFAASTLSRRVRKRTP